MTMIGQELELIRVWEHMIFKMFLRFINTLTLNDIISIMVKTSTNLVCTVMTHVRKSLTT